MTAQPDLFGMAAAAPALPEGLRYETGFLSKQEQAALLEVIETLPFAPMQYQGYTALREVVSYGGRYDFSAQRLLAAEPTPGWLEPLRERAAVWLGAASDAFTQALVSQYKPGTPLGWHRDVPDFEDIVGISLAADAVMRLRRFPPREPKKADVVRLTLAPRSIYLLRGPARWGWQHGVAPTKSLRYSVTFRTSRLSG